MSKKDKKQKNKKQNENFLKKIYSEPEQIVSPVSQPIPFLKLVLLSLVFGFIAGIVADIVSNAYIFPQQTSTPEVVKDITDLLDQDNSVEVTGTYEKEIKQAVNSTKNSIVTIYEKKFSDMEANLINNIYLKNQAKGNGIVLTSDGWIVSSKKVITDVSKQYVLFTSDLQKYEVNEFITDPSSDLVFFKLDTENLSVIELTEKNSLTLGQFVIAVNNSNAKVSNIESLSYSQEVENKDLIKSSEKFWKFIKINDSLDKSYQATAVVNLDAEMIGVVFDNIIFPSDFVVRAMRDVIKDKKVKRAYLGINYLDLAYSQGIDQKKVSNKNKGALVYELAENSPAAAAKIQKNDIVLKINDEEIDQRYCLTDIIQDYSANEKLTFIILRNNNEQEVEVELGEYVR